MSTEIVEIPAALEISPFPALGSANYNEEAYANGTSVPPAISRLREIALAARAVAVHAASSAQAADLARTQAASWAAAASDEAVLAMGYRNTAGGHASTASTKASEAAASAAAAAAQVGIAAAHAGSALQQAQSAGVEAVRAKEEADRAEAAADSIASGPIASLNVYSGLKTGAVTLALEDMGAQATDAQMRAGAITTPLLMSPANVKAVVGDSAALMRSDRSSNTQLVSADLGKLFSLTGTFTQTFLAPASLGAGWWCYIRNGGAGNITIPSSDARTNWIMYPNEMRLFQCDGSQLRSYVLTPYSLTMTASGTFIKPPGYSSHGGHLWAGGCSGVSYGGSSESTAPGGPGGCCEEFAFSDALVPDSVPVTIGSGGAHAQAVSGGWAGNPGGASSFGSLITAGSYSFSNGSFLGPTPNARTADGAPATAPTAKRLAAGSGGPAQYTSAALAAGGLSLLGGKGGNGRIYTESVAPTAGTAPGGGGGGSGLLGAPSAAGERGELRIWGNKK